MNRFLNKITCGDNCDLLGELPRECIDLVVTSPPYDDLRTYGGHSWDFFGVAWQLKRVLKPGGVIVWVVADATKNGSETGTSMEQALFFRRLGLNLHDTMIYAADKMPLSHNRYEQSWEYMFVFSNGKPNTFNPLKQASIHAGKIKVKNMHTGADMQIKPVNVKPVKDEKTQNNIWYFATGIDAERSHPAPFPLQLAKDHILSWSNPGDIVLDPFSGSGTTAKAAKELERQYIGFEINPEYCSIGEARTAQEVLSFATV